MDDYLVQAILVTVCCCLPFGIVGIVYAAQVKGYQRAGDIAGAVSAANNAKFWTHLGFGFGIAFGVLFGILALIGAVN